MLVISLLLLTDNLSMFAAAEKTRHGIMRRDDFDLESFRFSACTADAAIRLSRDAAEPRDRRPAVWRLMCAEDARVRFSIIDRCDATQLFRVFACDPFGTQSMLSATRGEDVLPSRHSSCRGIEQIRACQYIS